MARWRIPSSFFHSFIDNLLECSLINFKFMTSIFIARSEKGKTKTFSFSQSINFINFHLSQKFATINNNNLWLTYYVCVFSVNFFSPAQYAARTAELRNGLFIHTLKLSLSICKEIRGLQANQTHTALQWLLAMILRERSSTQARMRVTCSEMANKNLHGKIQSRLSGQLSAESEGERAIHGWKRLSDYTSRAALNCL